MNQSKMLNYLLGTTSKVEILRVLFESDDAMTGRRIAATASISPRSCQLSLDSLVKNKVLFRKAVGRAYSYTLNRNHKMSWTYLLPIFQQEKNIMKETGQQINRLCRSKNKEIASIFWRLKKQGKSEQLNFLIVSKKKKGAPDKEMVSKIEAAVTAGFGFATKGAVVAASEFSGKYFSSAAAKKRFENEFSKLKGSSFAELMGTTKKAKGREKKK